MIDIFGVLFLIKANFTPPKIKYFSHKAQVGLTDVTSSVVVCSRRRYLFTKMTDPPIVVI